MAKLGIGPFPLHCISATKLAVPPIDLNIYFHTFFANNMCCTFQNFHDCIAYFPCGDQTLVDSWWMDVESFYNPFRNLPGEEMHEDSY